MIPTTKFTPRYMKTSHKFFLYFSGFILRFKFLMNMKLFLPSWSLQSSGQECTWLFICLSTNQYIIHLFNRLIYNVFLSLLQFSYMLAYIFHSFFCFTSLFILLVIPCYFKFPVFKLFSYPLMLIPSHFFSFQSLPSYSEILVTFKVQLMF